MKALKLVYCKHIIQFVIEIYKRAWPVFFSLFGIFLVGAVQTLIFLKDYRILATIILLSASLFCLAIAIFSLVCNIKDARRKDKKQSIIDHSFENWQQAAKARKDRDNIQK